eukprot:2705046-Pyramimonas_sp.AAC.1
MKAKCVADLSSCGLLPATYIHARTSGPVTSLGSPSAALSELQRPSASVRWKSVPGIWSKVKRSRNHC